MFQGWDLALSIIFVYTGEFPYFINCIVKHLHIQESAPFTNRGQNFRVVSSKKRIRPVAEEQQSQRSPMMVSCRQLRAHKRLKEKDHLQQNYIDTQHTRDLLLNSELIYAWCLLYLGLGSSNIPEDSTCIHDLNQLTFFCLFCCEGKAFENCIKRSFASTALIWSLFIKSSSPHFYFISFFGDNERRWNRLISEEQQPQFTFAWTMIRLPAGKNTNQTKKPTTRRCSVFLPGYILIYLVCYSALLDKIKGAHRTRPTV